MTRRTASISLSVASVFMTINMMDSVSRSHSFRHRDSQYSTCFCHPGAGNVRGRYQYGPSDRILLSNNTMPVIEKIKNLCEVKGVLGQISRFRRNRALCHNLLQARRKRYQRPDFGTSLAAQ